MSGTVTADGSGYQGASVTITNTTTGNTLASATTNATGYYSIGGISAGEIEVEATADGYQTASKTETITDSPRSVNFSLSGSFTGQVVDLDGDPIAGATVQTIAYDFANYSGTIAEKREQAQQIRDRTFDVTPPDWEQDPSLFDGSNRLQDKPTYAVAHAYSDFDVGANPSLTDPSSLAPESPSLSTPTVTHPAGEALTVTLWDPSDTGFGQDDIDEQLPGATTSGTVVIERVDGAGNPMDTTTVETTDTFKTGLLTISGKTHEAVTIRDPGPGFYTIYPKGSRGAGYTVAVTPSSGGLNDLKSQLRAPLQEAANNNAQQYEAQAEELAEEMDAGNISYRSATTDSNGEFTLALDSSTLQQATVIAYKSPDVEGLGRNASRAEIRDYYESQVEDAATANLTTALGPGRLAETCGRVEDLPAYYRPASQKTTDTPADVEVTVAQVGFPNAVDIAARQCQKFNAFQNLRNTTLGEAIPNLAERIQNAGPEELDRILDNARSNVEANSPTCAEATRQLFGEAASECNVASDAPPEPITLEDGTKAIRNPTDTGPEYLPLTGNTTQNGTLTEAEVRDIIQAALQADDSVGDTAPTGPPDVTTGNETVSVDFPVGADLSDDPGLTLTARYSNGTERIYDQSSEYVSIETNALGDDIVRVQDFPLGSSAAVSFALDVATSENTASEEATVTNPSFSGTIPDLGHLRVSASQPGVGDTVVVEPGPAPQAAATFGGLQSAQAFAPNGTELNTTVSDGKAQFTTAAAGRHRVELTLTNPGGSTFEETTIVTAGQTATNRPPTLRAQTGALGTYAVATDGLAAGSIRSQQAGTRIIADAVIAADADAPSRLHVHEQGVDVQPTHSTQIRVLRGSERQQVRQRSVVVLHPQSLTEDALIYRNGQPAVQGTGESDTVSVTQANGSWSITSPTTDQGVVEIRMVNDPGFIQSTIFRVRTSIPDIPIIGWALIPSPGVAAFAVVLIGRRRRGPPGSGGATTGGEAA